MFIKYPKVYEKAEFATIKKYMPELEDVTFSVQEKLIGFPVQFMFSAGGSLTVGGRETHQSKKEGDITDGLISSEPYASFVKRLKQHCIRHRFEINLFGTVIGTKNSVPKIRFFDVYCANETCANGLCTPCNNELRTPRNMVRFMQDMSCMGLLCPMLATVRGFSKALLFNTDLVSKAESEDDGDVEFDNSPVQMGGVVIKPAEANVLYKDQVLRFQLPNEKEVKKKE